VAPTARAYQPRDRSAVEAVLMAAFGDPHVAGLDAALEAGQPGFALVAELDGVIVSQVRLSRGWVDDPRHLVEVLVLSPLGVLPGHQRQGVGRLLVAAALEEAQRRGAPLVFLEGDPRYYSRLGFVAAGLLGFARPSVRIPGPACQVAVLPGGAGITGALVYPDTFWALDCVGLHPPRS